MNKQNFKDRISADRAYRESKGYMLPHSIWVMEACCSLFRKGKSLVAISHITGVSLASLQDWRRYGRGGSWYEPEPSYEIRQPKYVVMPESAADCLIVAAELLWLARRPV